MNSTYISKVEKARTYAEEKDRVTITGLEASFRGNHNSYQVACGAGQWRLLLSSFSSRAFCSHIMALQRMLEGMLPRSTS